MEQEEAAEEEKGCYSQNKFKRSKEEFRINVKGGSYLGNVYLSEWRIEKSDDVMECYVLIQQEKMSLGGELYSTKEIKVENKKANVSEKFFYNEAVDDSELDGEFLDAVEIPEEYAEWNICSRQCENNFEKNVLGDEELKIVVENMGRQVILVYGMSNDSNEHLDLGELETDLKDYTSEKFENKSGLTQSRYRFITDVHFSCNLEDVFWVFSEEEHINESWQEFVFAIGGKTGEEGGQEKDMENNCISWGIFDCREVCKGHEEMIVMQEMKMANNQEENFDRLLNVENFEMEICLEMLDLDEFDKGKCVKEMEDGVIEECDNMFTCEIFGEIVFVDSYENGRLIPFSYVNFGGGVCFYIDEYLEEAAEGEEGEDEKGMELEETATIWIEYELRNFEECAELFEERNATVERFLNIDSNCVFSYYKCESGLWTSCLNNELRMSLDCYRWNPELILEYYKSMPSMSELIDGTVDDSGNALREVELQEEDEEVKRALEEAEKEKKLREGIVEFEEEAEEEGEEEQGKIKLETKFEKVVEYRNKELATLVTESEMSAFEFYDLKVGDVKLHEFDLLGGGVESFTRQSVAEFRKWNPAEYKEMRNNIVCISKVVTVSGNFVLRVFRTHAIANKKSTLDVKPLHKQMFMLSEVRIPEIRGYDMDERFWIHSKPAHKLEYKYKTGQDSTKKSVFLKDVAATTEDNLNRHLRDNLEEWIIEFDAEVRGWKEQEGVKQEIEEVDKGKEERLKELQDEIRKTYKLPEEELRNLKKRFQEAKNLEMEVGKLTEKNIKILATEEYEKEMEEKKKKEEAKEEEGEEEVSKKEKTDKKKTVFDIDRDNKCVFSEIFRKEFKHANHNKNLYVENDEECNAECKVIKQTYGDSSEECGYYGYDNIYLTCTE